MTEHFNKLKPDELERLALLMEDCSEVIHIIGKIIRHGYESTDPTKDDNATNRYLLQEEIGQLLWAVDEMIRLDDVDKGSIIYIRQNRKKKVLEYLHHYRMQK